jgi:hypothetical protein
VLQLVGARDAPRHRAPHFKRIQRRHAGAPFADFDGRKRHEQPLVGRADRETQLQLLRLRAIGLRRQRRVERAAGIVEQQRILARLLRKHPFGERGHEDGRKAASAQLRRARDEHAPVAPRRRLRFDARQPIGEHLRGLVDGHRTDLAHRAQIRQHAQHVIGISQDTRRELLEVRNPRRPCGLRRPGRERADDRQRKRAELGDVADLLRELIDPRRVRLGARQLSPLQLTFVDQPIQPPRPAVASRHDL